MPAVDLSLYDAEAKLFDLCLKMLIKVRDAEPSFGKYIGIKQYYDLMESEYGIYLPTMYMHQILLRKTFQELCPQQIDIPSHTSSKVLADTSNQMIPDGLVGISTNFGNKHSLFFSDVSDMIMFKLFLPPLGD